MPIRIRKRPAYVRWAAADSFQPMSLAQYMIDQINNGTTLPGGYGGGPWSIPTPGDVGTGGESTLLSRFLTVDGTSGGRGILYTDSFDTDDPLFDVINGGLPDTKYLLVENMFSTPNGAFYVSGGSEIDRDHLFIARAPEVGGDFVEIFNGAVAADLWGSASGTSNRLGMVGFNPLVPEEVIFLGANGNGHGVFKYNGAGDIIELPDLYGVFTRSHVCSYGGGKFLVGAFPVSEPTSLFDPSYGGLSVINADGSYWYKRAGQTGKVFVIVEANKLRVSLNNLVTHIDIDTTNLDMSGYSGVLDEMVMAVSDDGLQILSRNHGDNVTVMSQDGGYSFDNIVPLPSEGSYVYGGGTGPDSKWVAACSDGFNSQLYYNEHGGVGDWVLKTGNILDLSSSWTPRCMLALP